MKKVLLGACALSFIASANANVICDEVSYTGLFGGAGVVFSFDKNKVEFGNENANRSKTAFGGQIVIGYGHQFDNNMYVAIMHESLFSSKAKVNYCWNGASGNSVKIPDSANNGVESPTSGGTFNMQHSRKCWTPSFGLAMGYVVDGWNFGIRAGIQLDKFKEEYKGDKYVTAKPTSVTGITDQTHVVVDTAGGESISATSPYVGAYVEYKMGSFIGYMNVDHVFGKKKDIGGGVAKHKRPSWKAAAGVKFNVNLMN